MEVVAFTERVADASVRYQIIHLTGSAFVWAQAVPSSQQPGSLQSLSAALPAATGPCQPAATTVLPGGGATISRGVAQKLTQRCGIPIYACVDLPEDVGGVLIEAIASRILREVLRREENNIAVRSR